MPKRKDVKKNKSDENEEFSIRRPTVGELKAALADFPDDLVWWAYEGEVCGIIFASASRGSTFGIIHNTGRLQKF